LLASRNDEPSQTGRALTLTPNKPISPRAMGSGPARARSWH
jgi:hypothetical protein